MRDFLPMARRHLHSRGISKETIKPSSPTPPHLKTYNLSLADQLSISDHLPFVFLYPNYGSSNEVTSCTHQGQGRLATNSQSLKKSLSQTLSQYYPFSGRLTAENRSYVDCNDEGVVFVEAQVDATLMELMIHFQFHDNQLPLDELFPIDEVCDRPIYMGSSHIMMIQLSHFACGGLALAVSMSHKIGDASTFCNFVNHWAAVTRKNSGDEQAQPQPPHFIYSPNEVSNIPEEVLDKGNSLVTKRFVFPNSKLVKLKAKAAKDDKNAYDAGGEEDEMSMMNNPTRNEALVSLLYGCAVRAENKVNPHFVDSFVLEHAVNVRNKMVDPLPKTAVGNIILYIEIPTVTESELTLSHLTARMKKEMMQLTGLTTSLVNQMIRQAVDEAFRISTSNQVIETYSFSSICRFPLYHVDFGWGKPVRVNLMPAFMPKNFFLLMDAPIGDAIEALVCLEEENMAAFQNDDQLLAFAVGRPVRLNIMSRM